MKGFCRAMQFETPSAILAKIVISVQLIIHALDAYLNRLDEGKVSLECTCCGGIHLCRNTPKDFDQPAETLSLDESNISSIIRTSSVAPFEPVGLFQRKSKVLPNHMADYHEKSSPTSKNPTSTVNPDINPGPKLSLEEYASYRFSDLH